MPEIVGFWLKALRKVKLCAGVNTFVCHADFRNIGKQHNVMLQLIESNIMAKCLALRTITQYY